MNIIPREQWQSVNEPVTGPPIIKSKITTLPAHYTAASVIPADTAEYLRDIQHNYLTDPKRGYSIGYNFAIDQTGQAWECRGLDIKCAANKNYNEVTVAVLCLVNGQDMMNEKMVATFKGLGGKVEKWLGHTVKVVGHRDIGATSCPGEGIYAQVKSGLLTPDGEVTQPIPIPPVGDSTMTIRIFESHENPKEFNAMFFAECDAQNRSIELQWSGNGNDPRVMERINVMRQNFGDSFPLLLAGVKNNRLHPKHKPEDIIDSLHDWTDNDFAP